MTRELVIFQIHAIRNDFDIEMLHCNLQIKRDRVV